MRLRNGQGARGSVRTALALVVTLSMTLQLLPAQGVSHAMGQEDGASVPVLVDMLDHGREATPREQATEGEAFEGEGSPSGAGSDDPATNDFPEETPSLVAQQEASIVTVRFDANVVPGDLAPATGEMGDFAYPLDGEMRSFPGNVYVREGYEFVGWSTTPDGLDVPDDPQTADVDEHLPAIRVADAQEAIDLAWDETVPDDASDPSSPAHVEHRDLRSAVRDGRLTLYAQWQALPVEEPEGAGRVENVSEVPVGEKGAATASDPTALPDATRPAVSEGGAATEVDKDPDVQPSQGVAEAVADDGQDVAGPDGGQPSGEAAPSEEEPQDATDSAGSSAGTDASAAVEQPAAETVVDHQAFANIAWPAIDATASATNGVVVKVHAPQGAFPPGTSLRVTAVNRTDFLDAVEVATGERPADARAVDISFVCDGQEVEPAGGHTVDVTLQTLFGVTGQERQVVHLADDGEVTRVADATATRSEFTAESFSVYGITGEESYTRVFIMFVDKEGTTCATAAVHEGDVLPYPAVPLENGAIGAWDLPTSYFDAALNASDIAALVDLAERSAAPGDGHVESEETEFWQLTVRLTSQPIHYVRLHQGPQGSVQEDIVATFLYGVEGDVKDLSTVDFEPADWHSKLLGWQDEDDNTVSQVTVGDSDIDLYPNLQWGYWVYRNTTGGKPQDAVPVVVGADGKGSVTKAELGTPERAGYAFSGWYYDSECTSSVGDAVNIDGADVTVYASWTGKSVEYTVAYYLEGPEGTPEGSIDYYHFASSVKKTATAGSTVKASDSAVNGSFSQYYKSATYNTDEKEIAGDGSTVVNVYYSRDSWIIRFYGTMRATPLPGYFDLDPTGEPKIDLGVYKWGQDISMWKYDPVFSQNGYQATDYWIDYGVTGRHTNSSVSISGMGSLSYKTYAKNNGLTEAAFIANGKNNNPQWTVTMMYREYIDIDAVPDESPAKSLPDAQVGRDIRYVDYKNKHYYLCNYSKFKYVKYPNCTFVWSPTAYQIDGCYAHWFRGYNDQNLVGAAYDSSGKYRYTQSARLNIEGDQCAYAQIYLDLNTYALKFERESSAKACTDRSGIYYTAKLSAYDPEYDSTITKTDETTGKVQTFVGWYTTEVAAENYDDPASDAYLFDFDTGRMPAANLSLYAAWRPVIHKVTFDYDGNSQTADDRVVTQVESAETIAGPDPPSRDGYDFAGWFTDTDYTERWNFSNAVKGDMVLYAMWVKRLVPVSLEYLYGDGTATDIVDTNQYVSGATVNINAVPAQQSDDEGNPFAGWSTSPGGEVVASIRVSETNRSLYAVYATNVVVKAMEVSVVYDANCPEYPPQDVQPVSETYEVNGRVTIKALNEVGFVGLDTTGYTFIGWVEEDGKAYVGGETGYVDSEGAIFHAQWEPNVYEITLDPGESTTAGTARLYEKYATGIYKAYDGAACSGELASTNPIAVPTRTGWQFDGYYTAVDGGTQLLNERGLPTEEFTSHSFAEDTTLYAHWSKPYAYALVTSDGTMAFVRWGSLLSDGANLVCEAGGSTYAGVVYRVWEGAVTEGETEPAVARASDVAWWKGSISPTSIKKVVSFDDQVVKPTSTAWWFSGCTNLASADLRGVDSTTTEDMTSTFEGCAKLSEVYLGTGWRFQGRGIESLGGWALLPTPPTNASYTGKWAKGSLVRTAEELRDEYDDNVGAYAGYWRWESTKTKPYAVLVGTELRFILSDTDDVLESGGSGTIVDLDGASHTGTIWQIADLIDGRDSDVTWVTEAESVTSVASYERQPISPVSTASWFAGFSSLESADLTGLDTVTRTVSMAGMFEGCTSLSSVTLGTAWSFKGNGSEVLVQLPTPPTDMGYTQCWTFGTNVKSADLLAAEYTADLAGTWVWQKLVYPIFFHALDATADAEGNGAVRTWYEWYGHGVYEDESVAEQATDSSVALPASTEGFRGYFSQPGGKGEQLVDADGKPTDALLAGTFFHGETSVGEGDATVDGNEVGHLYPHWKTDVPYAVLMGDTLYFIRSSDGPTGDDAGGQSITDIGEPATTYTGYVWALDDLAGAVPWGDHAGDIKHVMSFSDQEIAPDVAARWFAGLSRLEDADLTGLDLTSATSTAGMFDGCDALAKVTLGEKFRFKGSQDEGHALLPVGIPQNGVMQVWQSADGTRSHSPQELAGLFDTQSAALAGVWVRVWVQDLRLPIAGGRGVAVAASWLVAGTVCAAALWLRRRRTLT